MYKLRFHFKRISVWIILVLQLMLISCYFLLPSENSISTRVNVKTKVTFLIPSSDPPISNSTYRTIYNKFQLTVLNATNFFDDFNSSLCYKMGTDLKLMHRSKDRNWKCNCLPEWHGNDCGQPEVVWRALLAYRRPLVLKGPRKYQRRIIYIIEVSRFDFHTAEITIKELDSFVDLFVLYENSTSNELQNKLENKFLKEHAHKILYVNILRKKNLWSLVKNTVTNLKDDDIVVVSKSNEIPNGLALQFLKLYDNWPQPIKFRLRWSIYGFFWLHPLKTILKGGASEMLYLYETYGDEIDNLYRNAKLLNKGLIVGDLNHFGGWYCEFCHDPMKIIDCLNSSSYNLTKKTIDKSFVEDMIENGIYLDGKMELVRTHRYGDKYYAPSFVSNNSWKYDWLLSNLYTKLDYY